MTDSTSNTPGKDREDEVDLQARLLIEDLERELAGEEPQLPPTVTQAAPKSARVRRAPRKPKQNAEAAQPFKPEWKEQVAAPRTFGPYVRLRVPVVHQGKVTDFGHTLKAIVKHNDKKGEDAHLGDYLLAELAGLDLNDAQVALHAFTHGGVAETSGHGNKRTIRLTDKGWDLVDAIYDGEQDASFVTKAVRPEKEVLTAVQNAEEVRPGSMTADKIIAEYQLNLAAAFTALLFVNEKVEVVR